MVLTILRYYCFLDGVSKLGTHPWGAREQERRKIIKKPRVLLTKDDFEKSFWDQTFPKRKVQHF